MDPNACLARLLDALADGDVYEARDALDDLRNWVNRGGFLPNRIGAGPDNPGAGEPMSSEYWCGARDAFLAAIRVSEAG